MLGPECPGLSAYLLGVTKNASQIRKAGRSRERTERVENVLTPDADAKQVLLRVPVLLLCHRCKSSLSISGTTDLGVTAALLNVSDVTSYGLTTTKWRED